MFTVLHKTFFEQQFQKFLLLFIIALVTFIFGKQLLPNDARMFLAHDETQAARIQQFDVNIQNGVIPPRIAPDFSYGLGYPVFNYYAPFPYWIAQLFQSVGFSVIPAMKLTYLLAIVVGFIGMFLLLKTFFPFYSALSGSFIYATSPYLAVDIFVRGNLGETWIFALLPWGFYTVLTNTQKRFILTAFVLSFLFTSHNILSLISLGLIAVLVLLTDKKLLNGLALVAGLLLSSYFLIPAITELSYVHAASIATKTQYEDHFLCLSQVWTSLWGYAGSAPGCISDGMSFMLGKIPILTGIAGMLIFLYNQYIYIPNKVLVVINRIVLSIVNTINRIYPAIRRDKLLNPSEINRVCILVFIVTIGSLYMTLYSSAWIWHLFVPILSLFQFPWRFLMFTLFGIAFFSAYLISNMTKYVQMAATVMIIILILLTHQKFFKGQLISYNEFSQKYLSQSYINKEVAYKVPEYLPVSADYAVWKNFEKDSKAMPDTHDPVSKGNDHTILIVEDGSFSKIFMAKGLRPLITNIHYAPYWQITIDGRPYVPVNFSPLGQPLLPISSKDFSTIQIVYKQTTIEQLANLLTFLTSVIIIGFTLKQFSLSWKNIITKT